MLTFSPALRAVSLTVATMALLTACGSAAAPHPDSPGGGVTSGNETQPIGAGASRASVTPSPPGAGQGGLAACRTGSLRVTVNTRQAGGAAGRVYYPVGFTNVSHSACGM